MWYNIDRGLDIDPDNQQRKEDLYESEGRTLGDVVALEIPNVEDSVHLKRGFWAAYNRLSEQDAIVISLLMFGYRYKDIQPSIENARYRIKVARKRFKKELQREGVYV